MLFLAMSHNSMNGRVHPIIHPTKERIFWRAVTRRQATYFVKKLEVSREKV